VRTEALQRLAWSRKVIDLAGKNFDVLGVHNHEYEPENFEIGVLEWNLSRTYD
jgi:alpha-N-arabinofuranosidase